MWLAHPAHRFRGSGVQIRISVNACPAIDCRPSRVSPTARPKSAVIGSSRPTSLSVTILSHRSPVSSPSIFPLTTRVKSMLFLLWRCRKCRGEETKTIHVTLLSKTECSHRKQKATPFQPHPRKNVNSLPSLFCCRFLVDVSALWVTAVLRSLITEVILGHFTL